MKKALILAHVASMIDLFNRDNIKILSELGYQVDIACNFIQGSVTSQKRVDLLKEELNNNNINSYQVPIPRSILSLKDLIYSFRIIRNIIKTNNYNIVHCQSPIGGVLSRLACRTEKTVKTIYMAHGFHFYKGAPIINWILYYPIEKYCSKYTDCLITINKEDYLLALNKMKAKQIIYIPGVGINLEAINSVSVKKFEKREQLNIPINSFVAMSVGELNKNKNHEVIIRAIAEIKEMDIFYIICGQGSRFEYLRKLANNLRVENKVIFLGYREDVIELYKISDVFVFPSKREGLSVSLMEAMACGLPIICSNIRGNIDLVDDGIGGILVDFNNIKGYSDALTKLFNDYQLRDKMKQNNLKAINQYDIKKINKSMKDIYENI